MSPFTPLQHAQSALANSPVGAVYKISVALGWRYHHYQRTVSGIVEISPGAYCRALGVG